ncbi:MAG: DUF423 domain-containing protein [Saprospiraceae bacterium]|jgi:uncharacterized membrane protein YgdD (TMEM256/DUF423 family)|nr:DUF423 domain-containing protein [Saprospiraceae bacterium]MBL0027148.1 DUF423 domain-containing protein [Saprospiraceae bacterium]
MNKYLKISAIVGALSVGIGAFGAHGLKPFLDANQLETFKTGIFYQFIHVIVMFSIALNIKSYQNMARSFYLFLVGIIFFSGSLYILSTKHLYGGTIWNFVGPITPIGGIFFIAGWLNLLFVKKI